MRIVFRVYVTKDGKARINHIQYPPGSHPFLRARAKEIVDEMEWDVARDATGEVVTDIDTVEIFLLKP